MKALLTVIVMLLFGVSLAPAQTATVPASRVEWRTDPAWPGWIGLWIDKAYAGALEPFEGTWQYHNDKPQNLRQFVFDRNPPKRKYDDPGHIGQAQPQPQPKPKAGVREEADPKSPIGEAVAPRDNGPPLLTGVEEGRLNNDGKSRYSIGGMPVDRSEALRAIEAANGIPDDAEKPRLIIIGTDAARKKVVSDLKTDPVFTYWRDKLVVLDYPPGHDHIAADRGFVQPKGDNVVIQAQSHDGGVYWRQESYTGPQPLARALRDSIKGYDSSKDPHPPDNKAPLAVEGEPGALGLIVSWLTSLVCLSLGGLGLIAAGVFAYQKRKATQS